MKPPITYLPNFVEEPDEAFTQLAEDLVWERRDTAPRSEYYSNDTNAPYTYGRGAGIRTYYPAPWHPVMLSIREKLEEKLECVLDVCFLNMYLDSTDWLGWHSDDSTEMNMALPIVSVSLGSERNIQFKRLEAKNSEAFTQMLEHGSAVVMHPWMQQSWMHRIPKVGHEIGPRISLTFRGFVR